MIKVKDELYTKGASTLVYFNIGKNKTQVIDANFRNALMKINNRTK